MIIMKIFDKTYDLAEKFTESEEFQELLNLKQEIQDKFKDLIEKFKEAQKNYEEAKKSKNPEKVKKYQIEFSNAKETLFSEELVSKYHELEKVLQDNLQKMAKQITSSISQRFVAPKKELTEDDKKESTTDLLQ